MGYQTDNDGRASHKFHTYDAAISAWNQRVTLPPTVCHKIMFDAEKAGMTVGDYLIWAGRLSQKRNKKHDQNHTAIDKWRSKL
jgi:hypothetical protein